MIVLRLLGQSKSRPWLAVFLILISTGSGFAQEPAKDNEPMRPGVTRPAEIPRRGVLQVELGGDLRGRGGELHSEQTLPVALRYAAHDRLAFDFGCDAVVSHVTEPGAERSAGFGDVTVGAQWVAMTRARGRPAIAIAFLTKLPTAAKELGSGTTDHSIAAMLTQSLAAVEVEAIGMYLNVGDTEEGRRRSGAALAVAISHEFSNSIGYVVEVSHLTEDGEIPKGTYGVGALTYRLSERARLDAGPRFGLSSDAPEISIVAGVSVGLPLRHR